MLKRHWTLGTWLVAGMLVLAACTSGDTSDEPGDVTTTAAAGTETTEAADEDSATTEGAQDPGVPELADEIVVVISEEIPTLESHEGYQASRAMPLRNIHEPLVDRDPVTNELVPALATSWERTDDLTWRFTLREGVTFHDGSPFDAEVAAFGINWTYQPDTGWIIRDLIGSAFEAVVVDEFTIDIISEAPDPILPARLWAAGIPSMRQLQEDPDSYTDTPIGTGPYEFVEWRRGESFTLEANMDWWGLDDPQGLGDIAFQRATFLIRPDANSRIAAIRAGEADFAWDLPADACRSDLGNSCVSGPAPGVVFFRLDVNNPVLADPRIREAINIAIDREGIGEALLGGAPAASQMVTASALGHNPDLDPPPFDPERARQLIEEAEADGVPVADTVIQLFGRQGNFAGVEQVTEAITAQLQEVGFNVSGETLETSQWREIFGNTEPDPDRAGLTKARHNNDQFDFQRTYDVFYHCEGNTVGCFPEIDAMAAEASTLTGQARAEAWQEINEIINTDYNVFQNVSVNEGLVFYGVTDRIEWTPRPDTQFLLKNVSLR